MQPQFVGQSEMSANRLEDVAMNVVETVCSIVSMPVEVILRPFYGTRHFPVVVTFFSAVMMLLLPVFSSMTSMIPFVRMPGPIGMYSIGSLAKLYFLLIPVHSFRLYRRMFDLSREQNSRYEGPPLPFFQLIPGSQSFWFTRIVLEPAFVFLAATLLATVLVFQNDLATYLQVAAVALAMKNFIHWYKAWEFLRELMDMRFAGPIIAKLVDDKATEEDLGSIHLASFPKNLSPDVRRAAVRHIAHLFSEEVPDSARNGDRHEPGA